MPICAEPGCDEEAAVRIHDPRGPDRDVCTGHGRALVQREGVVAFALDDVDDWR